MILDDIVASKKIEVERARMQTPRAVLEREIARQSPPRGFARALRRTTDAPDAQTGALSPTPAGHPDPGARPPAPTAPPPPVRVIAELKKASPSKGVIRPDFHPAAFARSYQSHGAAAISALTDEKFFQGGLNVLRDARAAVALPVLRKDFIIDPYQIDEARAAGADAILLIVAILDDTKLRAFREQAATLGMDCLVEVHSQDEARRAADSGARLIGVNNRDLQTFHTDLRHTERLLPALPQGAILVSESGIATAGDVRYLASLGIDAILVGETLMRHTDPGAGIDALLAPR